MKISFKNDDKILSRSIISGKCLKILFSHLTSKEKTSLNFSRNKVSNSIPKDTKTLWKDFGSKM